jgi:hypothetical protein
MTSPASRWLLPRTLVRVGSRLYGHPVTGQQHAATAQEPPELHERRRALLRENQSPRNDRLRRPGAARPTWRGSSWQTPRHARTFDLFTLPAMLLSCVLQDRR